jgi:hypothetical protein
VRGETGRLPGGVYLTEVRLTPAALAGDGKPRKRGRLTLALRVPKGAIRAVPEAAAKLPGAAWRGRRIGRVRAAA